MTEQEYLSSLRKLLKDLPKADREDAISFVQEYLQEARSMGRTDALDSLGSPEDYASQIRNGLDESESCKTVSEDSRTAVPAKVSAKNRSGLLLRILLWCCLPFVLMLCAVFGMLMACLVLAGVMILFAVILVEAAFLITVPAMIWKAMVLLFSSAGGFLFDLGLALVMCGLAWFVYLGLRSLFIKTVPAASAGLKKIGDSFLRNGKLYWNLLIGKTVTV